MRERDLDVLSYLWFAGEVLSLIGITAGAVLTLLARGPPGDSRATKRAGPAPRGTSATEPSVIARSRMVIQDVCSDAFSRIVFRRK